MRGGDILRGDEKNLENNPLIKNNNKNVDA